MKKRIILTLIIRMKLTNILIIQIKQISYHTENGESFQNKIIFIKDRA